MKVESEWIGYEGWQKKAAKIKDIRSRHSDLANVLKIKNWLSDMADQYEEIIGDMNEDEDSKRITVDREDLQNDYATLELAVKQLKHDAEVLAEKYGEDICHL